MDSRIVPTRPDVVSVTSEPRPTPRPLNAKFNEVLARSAGTVVQGAEMAMSSLPGTPLMAVALRGGASSPPQTLSLSSPLGSGGTTTVAEGPGAVGSSAVATGIGGLSPIPVSGGSAAPDGGIESSLAQSQQMNLYFLQIQQAMNAEDRTYTAVSNVLKSENDTVKNAIDNLR
jgi:hypothetical protein